MSAIDKLASALGHRDEKPNQELAQDIAASNDKAAVKELVDNLTNKNKQIQSDCIKTLYEVATLKPALVAPHVSTLLTLLQSKNNRMQWGAMTALSAIVAERPAEIYAALPGIMDSATAGSVITKDHAAYILSYLSSQKAYNGAFDLLLELMADSPENQFPSYAEKAAAHAEGVNKSRLLDLLRDRVGKIESETKRKRVEKVIRKLSK